MTSNRAQEILESITPMEASSVQTTDLDISIATSLFQDDNTPGTIAPRHSREVQYWKLCDREFCSLHPSRKGWVTVGPAYSPRTAVEYVEFQESKHATPLQQYGRAVSGEMFGGPTRFAPLIRGGGIREFPMDQMIAYGWHRRPQLRQIFPQLQEVTDIYCEHGCPTQGSQARVFTKLSDYQDHCSVMHKDVVSTDAMGRKIQEAIVSNNANTREDWAELAAAFVKALEQRETAKE